MGVNQLSLMLIGVTLTQLLKEAPDNYKVKILSTTFSKTNKHFTPLVKIAQFLHPDWPFLSEEDEDKALAKLRERYISGLLDAPKNSEWEIVIDNGAKTWFKNTYGYRHGSRKYLNK